MAVGCSNGAAVPLVAGCHRGSEYLPHLDGCSEFLRELGERLHCSSLVVVLVLLLRHCGAGGLAGRQTERCTGRQATRAGRQAAEKMNEETKEGWIVGASERFGENAWQMRMPRNQCAH